MIDCLLIGFNDPNFNEYVSMVRSMGTDSGGYRDLALAFREYEGNPCRSMDFLNLFKSGNANALGHTFNNADFLWPVLTYLGTYLKRRGHTFDYIRLYQEDKGKLRQMLVDKQVGSIAITTTLYVTPHPILEIVDFIRRIDKSVPIILGGPYIINQSRTAEKEDVERLFRYLDADYFVISSEGEETLANLLSALKSDGNLDEVPNLAFKRGDHLVFTPAKNEANALAENMVDYSLFPTNDMGQFVTLRTAKSCPFACAFCGFPQRAGAYTYMRVEDVERELNQIHTVGGVTTLTFLDDTFNVPKARFRDILRMMIRNNYQFKWNSFYRSDHGDTETIELMAEAGCEGVFLGIESGSDEMLLRMNKTARRKNYLQAIPDFRRNGVSTYASVIVGFPGESKDTLADTISLIEQAQPEYYRAQLWYCDPVTPIWKEKEKYNIQGSGFSWSHNTMTAAEACSWIEHMFLTVEGSTWLPQMGFEQWSTFYLQRMGLSKPHMLTFLHSFNAVIKESLLHPQKDQIDVKLLEGMRESCRFGSHEPPVREHLAGWSGNEIGKGLDFWYDEFRGILGASTEKGRGHAAEGIYKVRISTEILNAATRGAGTSSDTDTLAVAVASALSSLYRRPTSMMVAAQDGTGARFPLLVRDMELYGEGGVRSAVNKVQSSRNHLRFLDYAQREFEVLSGEHVPMSFESYLEISDCRSGRPQNVENAIHQMLPRLVISGSIFQHETTIHISRCDPQMPPVVSESLGAAIMLVLEQLGDWSLQSNQNQSHERAQQTASAQTATPV